MTLEDLMLGYCRGNDDAFASLYSRVAPRLLGYLRVLTGDAPTAEDLLQHTFAKVHAARASYVEGSDPVPWLYAIGHRTFIDEMRRRRRARVRLGQRGEELPDVEAGLSGTAVDAEENQAYDAEECRRVLEALAGLPDNQRMAVVLTKLDGKTVAEAARLLGISAGAVKLRAHRAYGRLRTQLRA